MTKKLSFTWSARREGNTAFIVERRPDGTHFQWGPMEARLVPIFIEARRRFIHAKMDDLGLTPIEDSHDWGFLEETKLQ